MMNTRKQKTPRNNKRSCKSELHKQLTSEQDQTRLHSISSRDFPASSLNALIQRKLIGKKAKYVCDVCLGHGKRLAVETPNSSDTDDAISVDSEGSSITDIEIDSDPAEEIVTIIDTLIQKLRDTKEMMQREPVKGKMRSLLEFLGTDIIRPTLKEDADHLQRQYKSAALLCELDSKDFIQQCNQLLIVFLCGVSGKKIELMDTATLYTFSVCVESIYHLMNRNLVLPHTFVANLIQATTSGSKTVTEVNGKISPSSSYTTYRTWFYNQGLNQPVTPKCNIDVFIDNIGKYIEKLYRVSALKNKSPTVVTAVLNIPLKSDPSLSNLQYREDMKPKHWSTSCLDENVIQEIMQDIISKSEEKFREYRFRYISEVWDFMQKSNEMDKGINDEMLRLAESKFTRKCDNCSQLHLPRKQKCSCGGRISSLDTDERQTDYSHTLPKYFSIGEVLDYNPTEVSLNEPIMLNPNSLKNLQAILDALKPLLITEGREWVFIGADGPPYALMRRLIKKYPDKYDWVVLVSGKGHLGMNELKTFFKIIDPVVGEALGKDVLNFNSPKSYSYFIDCKDTHKSWQSLEIFLHGTTMELLHIYSNSLDEAESPSVAGFLNWQAKCDSPTFKFIVELVLNIALPIYVQRVGDRHNDEECSDAGRYKFSKLFFGFNHPIYREVEYNELKQKAMFPREISDIRKQNISFSSTHKRVTNNHEGGDFKLENKIKQIKSITPKGKKDIEMWRRTIRAAPTVSKVLQHGREMLKLYDDGACRITRSEKEIVKWRALLRHTKYLSVNSPYVQNIAGTRLSNSLLEFGKVLDEKRLNYWELVRKGVPLESIRYDNVNVLCDNSTSDEDVFECYEFRLDTDDENADDEDTIDEET